METGRHSNLKVRKRSGFLTRMKTAGGRKVIKRQRQRQTHGKESLKHGVRHHTPSTHD